MPNPPSHCLDLAQQGNLGAIALLINQRLRPHGIQARVALRGENLCLLLEADPLPEKAAVVAYLRRYLVTLKLPMESVQVYGRLPQARYPDWADSFSLPPGSPPANPPSPPAAIAPPSHVRSTPRPTAKGRNPVTATKLSAPLLWLQWQGVTLQGVARMLLLVIGVGLPLVILLGARLHAVPLGLAFLVGHLVLLGVVLYGLLVGDAQACYLQSWLPQSRPWRRATALGMPLGVLAAGCLQGIGVGVGFALTDRPLPILGWFLGGMLGGAIALGFILGGLQWQVLRAQVPDAHRWIGTTIAGSALGSILGWGSGGVIFYSLARSLHLAGRPLSLDTSQDMATVALVVGLSALFGTLVNWCVFQALTATTLVGLLKRMSEGKSRS
ncbi:MAG: hypothetical protein VKK04_26795 [Synechococcales bacterium]|nr:hypothetical protein [Synechococcales bacterium]